MAIDDPAPVKVGHPDVWIYLVKIHLSLVEPPIGALFRLKTYFIFIQSWNFRYFVNKKVIDKSVCYEDVSMETTVTRSSFSSRILLSIFRVAVTKDK